MAGCAGACVRPSALAPTVDAQRDALLRLDAARRADHACLRSAVAALLEIRRERLLASIERDIASRLTTPLGLADASALDADLASPTPGTALGAEVRSGRLTREQAHTVLRDYAAARALSEAAAYRRGILASLAPVRAHDAAAEDLLASLDVREASEAALAADALAGAGAAASFAKAGLAPPAIGDTAEQAWRAGVLSRIPDPQRRAAAQRLLQTALGLGADRPLTTASFQGDSR